jgi:formate-dependent nitrite reductase membrane component NrfD
MYLAVEHFVRAPAWTWYILGYFFFAGLCGGSYALATLLRLVGDPRDEPAARLGFYASFATLLVCPILLTADLGASWLRFWHMLVDVTPGDTGLILKYWSPMSIGAWALFILGFFVTASALLSVSNQPIWSDTWMLGGLFLASGLSGSAALMALLTRYRPETVFTLDRILEAEAYFSILELVVFVLFFITIIAAGTAGRTLPLFPLWLLALAGIAASLVSARGHLRLLPGGRSAVIARASTNVLAVAIPVLIGVLALRAAVIFSAQ